MSSTDFGEDRLYGAIDDDDDFIEEWRSSWEPTPSSHINEVIEPVAVSAPESGSDESSEGPYETEQGPYETEPSPFEATPVEAEAAEPIADDVPDLSPEAAAWQPEPVADEVPDLAPEAAAWQPEPVADEVPEVVAEAPSGPEAPAEYQLSDLELERVYEQGLYAPSVAEPAAEPLVAPIDEHIDESVDESVEEAPAAAEHVAEEPAAFVEPVVPVEEPVVEQPAAVAEKPLASQYDIEGIHAGIASDPTLESLAATVVAAHPLTPVVAPEPFLEWTPPATPEPEFAPEPSLEWTPPATPEPETAFVPVAEQWTPPAAPEPESAPEPVEVPVEPAPQAEVPAAEAFAASAEPEAPSADTLAEAEESAAPEVDIVPEVADAEPIDEPEVAPLEAPDEYDAMELVEWEPEPLAAFGPPVEAPTVEDAAEAVPTITPFAALPELSDVPAEQIAEAALEPASYAAPEPLIEPEPEITPEPAIDSVPQTTPLEPVAEYEPFTEPEPVAEPVAEPEPVAEYQPFTEPDPVAEPEPLAEYESAAEPTEDPDHSVGLTGAAAAALAASAAWGVRGQPAAAVAEAFVEPEPEPYMPSVDDASLVAEPAAESYEAEAEPIIASEPYTEPAPLAKPAVSDSESWVARSMDTTPIPEPEAVTAPQPDAWAAPDLETTPIPEPGTFIPPVPETFAAEPAAVAEEILDADSSVTIAPMVAPELSDHEAIHAWAAQADTYNLQVDVTSIVGTATHVEPAEVAAVAPDATDAHREVVVTEEVAQAIFPDPEPLAEQYDAWMPAAASEPAVEPEPVIAASPFAPPPVPIDVASPFAPPPVPIDVESPFAQAAPVERVPFAAPADPYVLPSYEPVEIRPYESLYAPVVEPTQAAPATVEDVWPEPVPSAPAWSMEATEEATHVAEHAEASHEHGASGWLERAKARVADIYYDPDADAPVIADDEDSQTRGPATGDPDRVD